MRRRGRREVARGGARGVRKWGRREEVEETREVLLLSGATHQWRKEEQVYAIRIVKRTASGSPRPGGSQYVRPGFVAQSIVCPQPDVGPPRHAARAVRAT